MPMRVFVIALLATATQLAGCAGDRTESTFERRSNDLFAAGPNPGDMLLFTLETTGPASLATGEVSARFVTDDGEELSIVATVLDPSSQVPLYPDLRDTAQALTDPLSAEQIDAMWFGRMQHGSVTIEIADTSLRTDADNVIQPRVAVWRQVAADDDNGADVVVEHWSAVPLSLQVVY